MVRMIDEKDLEVTTGCAAVHPDQRGGQHVAMRCTGVRITHGPSGISVMWNDERSQHANRVEAMRRLRLALIIQTFKLDVEDMSDDDRLLFFEMVKAGYCDGCGRKMRDANDRCHCQNDD